MFTVIYKHNARHYPVMCIIERDGVYELAFMLDRIDKEKKTAKRLLAKGGLLRSFSEDMLKHTTDHYDRNKDYNHTLRLSFLAVEDYYDAKDNFTDYIDMANRQGLLSPTHSNTWYEKNCIHNMYNYLMDLCEYSTDDPLAFFKEVKEDYESAFDKWNSECMEKAVVKALTDVPVIGLYVSEW